MAYPALISLKQTINDLVNSDHISLVSSTRKILESAYNDAASLQELLNRRGSRSSERLAALDGEIRDRAHQLEDVLEFHELDPQHEEVTKAIASFSDRAKKVEVEYIQELSKPVDPQHDDEEATVLSNVDFGVQMVGNSKELEKVLRALRERIRPHELWFYLMYGRVGTGATITTRAIFEEVGEEFDCRAWVRVGSEYQLKQVLIQIISQVDSNQDHHYLVEEEEELFSYLRRVLEHRRYMIVLDGVRNVVMAETLRTSLPNQNDGSIVFLISSTIDIDNWRDAYALYLIDACYSYDMPIEFFIAVTWPHLRMRLLGVEPVPPEMEEAGKKIFENCESRFISLAKVLLFLWGKERTIEEWSKLAADKENPIFIVEDEISTRRSIIKEMQSYNLDLDDENKDGFAAIIRAYVDIPYSIEKIKKSLRPERFFSKLQIVSLLGMAGIGKTTLAKRILRDIKAYRRYDYEAWITLGPKYQADGVLIDILVQIYPDIDRMRLKADAALTRSLCVRLSKERCLIVLDDVWSKDPLRYLKNEVPDIMGTILITTRQEEAAKFGEDDICLKMKLLDKEESWFLFRQKVFGGGFCPTELEMLGRKIAEDCDGLPLLILVVADQLLKFDKTKEFWNDVAFGKDKLMIFKNAHDQISKSLLPSYQMLPENLKACFLYIGGFRKRFEIPTLSLANLWIAERILETSLSQTVENFAADCLSELVARSLVMTHNSRVSDSQIKTCRLHSVFWHLANTEAVKTKFFHAMNFYMDCSNESVTSHRRLCIRNNVLLGMEDVNDFMKSFKTTHSLLCVGPPHQYQVPINFNMRLLRVMDALTIRLYEVPVEVVKLIHLRYLGLTCNNNLPPSISSLRKLQYLIVKRYMSIKSSKNCNRLPMEIWEMRELVHLQIVGGRLPNPNCGGGLPKLLTLLDVSVESCMKKVLKRIPNLKRLGIRIELAPDEKHNPFRFLNRISRLRRLESLKCVVVNPHVIPEDVAPPAPLTMFPSSLRKLSLSGFGYPWEYMSIISEMENLEVLKLKHYAFRGPKWVMGRTEGFENLKFLLMDDTDLVHWEINRFPFKKLNHLSIKHCYKLQNIPMFFTSVYLSEIEIVDCNSSVVTWTEKLREIYTRCDIDVNLSWLVPERRSAA